MDRYPRNFPIQVLPVPPAISVFTPKVQRTSQIPSTTSLCRHSFNLPKRYGPPITPASPHTGHWRLQSQGSARQGLPTGQLVGAPQPELSKGERSCVRASLQGGTGYPRSDSCTLERDYTSKEVLLWKRKPPASPSLCR